MNFFSIVSEFNPFHNGHKHLIEQTKKKTGADGIVCIMSGSMVQRGDVAIYDKWTRAGAAVKNGADLVIELPVCYVLQSADIFAKGAVEIINAIGSRGIAFGSECTDTEQLLKIAKLRSDEPENYKTKLNGYLNEGMGYPAACLNATADILGELPAEISLPNSTLGISYLSAINKINPSLEIHIEQRLGNYHSTDIDTTYPSATAIRHKILSGDKKYENSLCTSDTIYDINNISSYILGFFRSTTEDTISKIAGMEPGLAQRLIKASKESTNLEDFVAACISKRYTAHRIRRLLLSSILKITEAPPPQYARVLALNGTGAEILKKIKQQGNIEVITKISRSEHKDSVMLKQDILATDISSLCAGQKASMDFLTTPVVIGKD